MRTALLACGLLIALLVLGLWNLWPRPAGLGNPASTTGVPYNIRPGSTEPVAGDGLPTAEAVGDDPETAAPAAAEDRPGQPEQEVAAEPAVVPSHAPVPPGDLAAAEHSADAAADGGAADAAAAALAAAGMATRAAPAAAAEVPAIPAGPWSDAFSGGGELPAFADVCFTNFDPAKSLVRRQDMEAWFATVPGQRCDFKTVKTRYGESARFEGLMRLKMPWRDDAVLRLSLAEFDRLKIHLFTGGSGTTLAYYEREHPRWTAYVTQREPGKPRPQEFTCAASDAGRTRRTNVRAGAPMELRCCGGEAVLSHGDIVLLRAPLAAMPSEVYFEGQATFYGVAAGRSLPPERPAGELQNVVAIEPPAQLQWTEQLKEGARLERSADGSVQLVAEDAKEPGWIAAPIPFTGLCEVVLRLDEFTDGTGVFIGGDQRRPSHVLRFVKDTHSGRVCAVLKDFDTRELKLPDVQEAFLPVAPQSPWIRLLLACGCVHWWISDDGEHWVSGDKNWGDLSDPATHFGLMHLGGLPQARIVLRQASIRPLANFNALADAELVSKASALASATGYSHWLTLTTEQQPQGVRPDAWRRASALAALARGCQSRLGTQLIKSLLDQASPDEAASEGGAPDEAVLDEGQLQRRLALLEEAARMLTIRDDTSQRELLMQQYRDAGMAAARSAGPGPYSSIRRALMSVPLGSHDEFPTAPEHLVAAELIQFSYQERWQELLDLCRRLRFFRKTDAAPLRDWAEATALRNLPQGAGGDRLVGRKADWTPPWIEEVSKPTYNFLAELQAMLDSGAWQDAGRLIAALDDHALQGLSPYLSDDRHYVSLSTAIGATLADQPQLQEVILQQYAELARLRVHGAMARADAAALQLATIQFAGTEAAAQAQLWLGDRALAGGWFATALSRYRQAEPAADPALRSELTSRQRLTAALQGQPLDGAVGGGLTIGDQKLSAEEFQRLIDELASSRADSGALAAGPPMDTVPKPTGYRLQRRGRLDGPLGKDVDKELIPHSGRLNVDWVGRQLATAVADDTLYVSNRFQVSAYNLGDGSRRWQTAPPGLAPLRAQDWGLIPMRPLLTRERVFARLLYEPGPLLVCLDRASGALRWTAEIGPDEAVVSDPLLVQGQLVALTVKRQEQAAHLLRLVIYDADTGSIQETSDLLRLNESWQRRHCCEAVVDEDALIAVLAGVTICCDLQGDVRWLRRQTVLPADEAPNWILQAYQRPLRVADRVVVIQPGVPAVECLDAGTGRLIWSRNLPGVQRLVGQSDQRVIVQADNSLRALHVDDGRTLWQQEVAGILHGAACDSAAVLLAQPAASRRAARIEGLHLVWLDAASGHASAVTALAELNAAEPRLGPLVAWRDRVWTFYSQGKKDPNPELIELVPEGAADEAWDSGTVRNVWTQHLPSELVQAVPHRFPGWELLSGEMDKKGPLVPERLGRNQVLVAHAKSAVPVVLTRAVSIPASGKPRLRFAYGHSGDRDWVLEIRLGGEVLYREEIKGRSGNEPWKTTEVDLSAAAGRSGQLVIEAQLRSGDLLELFWSDLEIVF